MERDRSGAPLPRVRRLLDVIRTRRFLDVVADVLTLAALAVAGLGHLAPWIVIEGRPPSLQAGGAPVESSLSLPARTGDLYRARPVPGDVQLWHAARSGAALGGAALLVGASLVLNLGLRARKILVLLMFLCVLAAVVFQMMIFSPYPLTEAHRALAMYSVQEHDGLLFALVPSVIAGGLCLVRMLWTMTASPRPKESELEE